MCISSKLTLTTLVIVCLFCFCSIPNRAFSADSLLPASKSQSVLSSQCGAFVQPNWTNPEKWVWKEICEGREADFNKKEGTSHSPSLQEGWPETRVLRARFLELIVIQGQHADTISHRGIRITGAWFKEPIDLSDAVLTKPLRLKDCRFDTDVNLSLVQSSHGISFAGSGFYGIAIMPRLQVAGSLRLNQGTFFKKDVLLSGAKIGDVLSLDNVQVAGLLDMNSVRVDTNVFMENSQFHAVRLHAAQIGGDLYMAGSSFNGPLSMNGLLNRGSVYMSDGATFANVEFRGAHVDGRLLMNNSSFTSRLNMEALYVGDAVVLKDSHVTMLEPIELPFARIDSILDITGSTLPSLNLTGTLVRGELRLGSEAPSVQWQKGAKLKLRNTQVGVLQDQTDAWPEHLDLDGFTYGRLGGMGSSEESDPMQRDIDWFRSWLLKQQPFSPQPYEQLSSLFRASGHAQRADQIRYWSKERERQEVATGVDWLWLTLLKVFIGYGYHIISHISLWIVTFTAIGTFMLKLSQPHHFDDAYNNRQAILPSWLHSRLPRNISHSIEAYLPLITYSFDRFLPMIRLKHHSSISIDLHGWVAYYFYFHQFIGFFLASLLVASLIGLTGQ